MASVAIQLLTWNGEPYIPYLVDSLKKQTYRDWSLAVLDNASNDETVAALEGALKDGGIDVSFAQNERNVGFAAGHNQLFRAINAPYVLVLNQDIYLEPDCVERLAAFLDAHTDVAAVAPRLMKWNFSYMTGQEDVNGDLENIFTDIIDSLGITVFRNRRVVNTHEGELWSRVASSCAGGFVPVFGVSGACAMFRYDALAFVAFQNGDVFDASYGSYKEDVDLAFRLQSAGYNSVVLTEAVAYHARGAAALGMSDASARKNKKTQRDDVRYNSYRNHLVTIWKNEYWQNVLLDFSFIAWYEGKKLAYNLFCDRGALGGFGDIWRHRKAIAEKRRYIAGKRNIDWREVRKWMI